ncbi:MAG: polyprenyl synthetase family protein [Candidatus Micrarchaeota archaeon]
MPDSLQNFYSRLPIVEREMVRLVPRDAEPAEVYSLLWELLDRGGKRFRPLLCLASARAVGGSPKHALAAATAIELFHNFTLIHDDIEDNSTLRRGKPCLHVAYGLPLAINAGDGLFMIVWKAALRIRSRRSIQAQHALLSAFTAVLEGQATELGWHHYKRWDISEEDYLSMIGGKTAALIAVSCDVGALLGGGDAKQCKALHEFGRKIGLAFQIQDDVLNLVGTEEKYRKEIGGDIKEGKRTVMVIHAFPKLSAADAARLKSVLGNAQASDSDVAACIQMLRRTGSIEYARKYAERLTDEALAELGKLPKSSARDEMEAVVRQMIARES